MKSRNLRWAGHVARMEEGRSAGTSAENIPFGSPRRRWVDRMNLKQICINTRNWVESNQDRNYWRALVDAALNPRVPYAMELVR